MIAVVIQVTTLVVCYFSWVLDGCDPFIPFISDTDTNPASSWAFTIGFTLTGTLTIPLSIQFYNVREKVGRAESWVQNRNYESTLSYFRGRIRDIHNLDFIHTMARTDGASYVAG